MLNGDSNSTIERVTFAAFISSTSTLAAEVQLAGDFGWGKKRRLLAAHYAQNHAKSHRLSAPCTGSCLCPLSGDMPESVSSMSSETGDSLSWRARRVLVTGGAGFIGSALVWGLNQRGCTNIVIADFPPCAAKECNLAPLQFEKYVDPSQLP